MKQFSPRVVQAFREADLPTGLQVQAAGAVTEILIYDRIGKDAWSGEGVGAVDFLAALAKAGAGAVNVRINSPGGDVFEGMAIYNALRAHRGAVTCCVDGIAASAASFIACAGDTIGMAETSMLMIHNASTLTWGNRHDLAATAEILAKVDGQIADIYARFSGRDAAEFGSLMDAETYMTAEEAVVAKLASKIVGPAPKPTPAPDNSARERRLRMAQACLALS